MAVARAVYSVLILYLVHFQGRRLRLICAVFAPIFFYRYDGIRRHDDVGRQNSRHAAVNQAMGYRRDEQAEGTRTG